VLRRVTIQYREITLYNQLNVLIIWCLYADFNLICSFNFLIFMAVCLNISTVINIKILTNSNQQTQSYKFISHIAAFLSVVLITEMLEICIRANSFILLIWRQMMDVSTLIYQRNMFVPVPSQNNVICRGFYFLSELWWEVVSARPQRPKAVLFCLAKFLLEALIVSRSFVN
jgi:hypothetical protein